MKCDGEQKSNLSEPLEIKVLVKVGFKMRIVRVGLDFGLWVMVWIGFG